MEEEKVDFDFSTPLSISQIPSQSIMNKFPGKRGRKSNLTKLKEEILAGVQKTIFDYIPNSTNKHLRRACCSPQVQ